MFVNLANTDAPPIVSIFTVSIHNQYFYITFQNTKRYSPDVWLHHKALCILNVLRKKTIMKTPSRATYYLTVYYV
jgi:hypothetical protein